MWKVSPYLCLYNMHYMDTVGHFASLLVRLRYPSLCKHVCMHYASVCISIHVYASKMHTRILCTEPARALERQGLSAYDKVTCAYRYLHTHTHIFTPRHILPNTTQTLMYQRVTPHHAYHIHMYAHTPNIHTCMHSTYLQCKYMEITCHTTHTAICQALNLHDTYIHVCITQLVCTLYASLMPALQTSAKPLSHKRSHTHHTLTHTSTAMHHVCTLIHHTCILHTYIIHTLHIPS